MKSMINRSLPTRRLPDCPECDRVNQTDNKNCRCRCEAYVGAGQNGFWPHGHGGGDNCDSTICKYREKSEKPPNGLPRAGAFASHFLNDENELNTQGRPSHECRQPCNSFWNKSPDHSIPVAVRNIEPQCAAVVINTSPFYNPVTAMGYFTSSCTSTNFVFRA